MTFFNATDLTTVEAVDIMTDTDQMFPSFQRDHIIIHSPRSVDTDDYIPDIDPKFVTVWACKDGYIITYWTWARKE